MSSDSNITLSVVIVSYNVRQYVLEAIASVYQYVSLPTQIIVADNYSKDGTVEAIKTQFPEVTIIENKDNVGFSAANNQCFERCTGKYIVMLNPDALFIDTSFQKMLDYLANTKESDSVLIGPKLINTDNSTQVSCWKFPSPVQHLLELFFLNTLIDTTMYQHRELEKETPVDFLSGACVLMKRSTLLKLKGLDVNLFWMDDVDLGKRNMLIGGKNIYFPLTTVKHHIGQSSKKNQTIVISNQIISKLKFYKKHHQLFYFYSSVPLFFLQILSRIPLFFVLGIIRPVYFSKAKAYVYTLSKFFSYLVSGNQNPM
ncbi:MAG: glycosyltransferase family 2 protein [Bacteroidetes bacterium]|nr:glycosyltransferase family 2 protein [Bacteroidota bacterium]